MSTFVLLKNSGFSHTDIPDSMSTLTAAGANAVVDDNTIFIRQTRSLTQIKAKCTPSQASQVDYVIVEDSAKGGNTCYFVDGYEMTSPQTAVFSLSLDAVTTLNLFDSGSAFGKLTGWVTQRTKSKSEIASDDQALITMQDGFVPSEEPVDVIYDSVVGANKSDNKWFLVSTIDLNNLELRAKDYVTANNDSKVTVPELPSVPASTSFGMLGLHTWKLQHMGVYDSTTSGMIDNINTARSLGVESSIQESYTVPGFYVNEASSSKSDGLYSHIEGTNVLIDSGATATVAGVTVENKKAMYAGTRIKLMSMASGEQAEYTVAQIGNNFHLQVFANCESQGKPYFRFEEINGNSSSPLYGAVPGAQWQNASLGYASFRPSGEANLRHRYNDSLLGGSITSGANAVASGATTMMGVDSNAGAASAALGGAAGASSIWGNIFYKQGLSELRRAQLLNSPQIQFPQALDMQNYVGNDATIVVTHETPSDIIRRDEYYHKFGEAVSEKFTVSLAHQNAHYDYLELGQCSITNTSYPRYIVNQALAQLQGGVRVWHTQPTASALEIGGN